MVVGGENAPHKNCPSFQGAFASPLRWAGTHLSGRQLRTDHHGPPGSRPRAEGLAAQRHLEGHLDLGSEGRGG